MPLSQILVRRRNELGLSQRDMAALCGVSQQQWSEWERGHTRPGIGRARQLAAILNMEPAAVALLIADKPTPPPKTDPALTARVDELEEQVRRLTKAVSMLKHPAWVMARRQTAS